MKRKELRGACQWPDARWNFSRREKRRRLSSWCGKKGKKKRQKRTARAHTNSLAYPYRKAKEKRWRYKSEGKGRASDTPPWFTSVREKKKERDFAVTLPVFHHRLSSFSPTWFFFLVYFSTHELAQSRLIEKENAPWKAIALLLLFWSRKFFFSPLQLIKKQAEITSRQQPFFYHLGKEYHLAKEVSGGQKNEL